MPRPHIAPIATLLLLGLGLSTLPAADLSLAENGIRADVGGMGTWTVPYPLLQPGDRKPLSVAVAKGEAVVSYPEGRAVVRLAAGGRVELRFQDLPAEVKAFRLTVNAGPDYADGGRWQMVGGPGGDFPAQQPEQPFLFQGQAEGIAITDPVGRSVRIAGLPSYAYNQLQDNREWGWKMFTWWANYPLNPGWTVHAFAITSSQPDTIAIQVDRFGQTTRKDFPGKVRDEAELIADRDAEAAYYASFEPQATDAYGGLPGTKERFGLEATGFFRVEQLDDGRWLLVTPEGNACFHLGICSFEFDPGEDATWVVGREDIYEWLPPKEGAFAQAWHHESWWSDKAVSFFAANCVRKYGPDFDKAEHLATMIDRVTAMGFNAIGAFAQPSDEIKQAKHVPYVRHIGFGPDLPGIRGVPDPFDPETLRKMDESWAKRLAPHADDPLIVGYFFANEQGMEDIPRGIPKLDGSHAAKRELVTMLRARHGDDIAAFNAAWGLDAERFDQLADRALPVQTEAAFADVEAYTEHFLETLYRVTAETFRKYDPNHLMLGHRWQPGTANSEVLCRMAGRYMDVVSINYYTLGVDKAFVERLHRWTGGKPQMWSEFYYTSGPESNAAGGGLDMATQDLRGQAYRQYVEHAADLGFVVGIEWFTLVDQAVTGRWFSKLTGERNNTGIFNVADRPYRDMIAHMATAHQTVYEVWLDGREPFVLDDPRFTGAGRRTATVQAGRVEAGATMAIDGAVDGWPGRPGERIGGDRLVSGKDAEGFEATFKLSWDHEHLYLLANVIDPTPMRNTKTGGQLWNGDAIELFIGHEDPDRAGSLLFSDRQLLLGAKSDGEPDRSHVVNAPEQPAIPMAVVPDTGGYTLEAAIPWSALGIQPKDGTDLLFDIAIDDSAGDGRSRQLMWNGGSKNSSDRSYWGRLTLVP